MIRFAAATPNAPPTDVATLSPMLPDVTVMDPAQLLPAVAAATAGFRLTTLLWNLVLGFFGGLIFNITPCVFPVISIKIIGFVKQAGEDRGRVLRLGLTFCAGIMVWFWIFGILTGLGQVPMQHPPVVIGLTAVLFIFAMNLFGVFEIVLPGAATDKLAQAASREGYSGTFMKGLLATLLGTACTAPLFAGAAAYATTQPRVVAFLIFTAAGLGMSSPYVLLSAFPGWLKRIPKPGAWMVIFKQAMGFVLLATAVWLLVIVGDLLDAQGVVWTVAFLGFLGASAWLIGKIQFNWGGGARFVTWVAAIAIAAFGVWFSFVKMYDLRAAMQPKGPDAEVAAVNTVDVGALAAAAADAVAKADWTGHIPWQSWRPGLPEELSRRGFTVYVDFTATWCFTCQTNKATSLDIDSARTKMRDTGVIPLKGDYTKQDASIRKQLLAFGVNSVPLNLIYPAGRPEAIVQLPVILTPGIVSDALDKAGPSAKKPQDSPIP